jgi:hypothetical protein
LEILTLFHGVELKQPDDVNIFLEMDGLIKVAAPYCSVYGVYSPLQ